MLKKWFTTVSRNHISILRELIFPVSKTVSLLEKPKWIFRGEDKRISNSCVQTSEASKDLVQWQKRIAGKCKTVSWCSNQTHIYIHTFIHITEETEWEHTEFLLYNSYRGWYLTFRLQPLTITSTWVFTCAKSGLHHCFPLCSWMKHVGHIVGCS